jgi:hypothetical protein
MSGFRFARRCTTLGRLGIAETAIIGAALAAALAASPAVSAANPATLTGANPSAAFEIAARNALPNGTDAVSCFGHRIEAKGLPALELLVGVETRVGCRTPYADSPSGQTDLAGRGGTAFSRPREAGNRAEHRKPMFERESRRPAGRVKGSVIGQRRGRVAPHDIAHRGNFLRGASLS